MNKRQLHRTFVEVRQVNPWYFLVAGVISGGVGVYALRQNNFQMLKLKQMVEVADRENGDVEAALRNLRVYVHGHMNTNLASGPNPISLPIQLKYRYERLVQAEKDRVSTENTKIYSTAQATCERLYPDSFSGGPRIPCIAEYVTKNGVAQRPIPSDLYKFDFVSPRWSPDVAGMALLISAVSGLLFLIRYGLERWLKSELRQ